jgi:hypothetical protein
MKKFIAAFLCMLLVHSSCGCAHNAENFEVPANFYYIQSQDTLDLSESMLRSEIRETKVYENQFDKLLNAYFKGPVTDKIISPFPADLSVVHIEQRDDTLTLTLSNSFAQLEGLDLTIAATCIALTLFELSSCELLELRAENKLANGKEIISLSRDVLYLTDISHQVG